MESKAPPNRRPAMSKTPKPQMPPEETPEAVVTPDELKRKEVIRVSVLKALGRPSELLRVNVMPLWGNHFRVNIVTGEDATAVTIPNSYFVTVDERGTILRSEPIIQKLY
jgi:hypothetical protein